MSFSRWFGEKPGRSGMSSSAVITLRLRGNVSAQSGFYTRFCAEGQRNRQNGGDDNSLLFITTDVS
jgi:hypothetical protein